MSQRIEIICPHCHSNIVFDSTFAYIPPHAEISHHHAKKAENQDSRDSQDQFNLRQYENKDEFPLHNPQPPNKEK